MDQSYLDLTATSDRPLRLCSWGIVIGGGVVLALYAAGFYQPLLPGVVFIICGGGVVGYIAGLLTHDRFSVRDKPGWWWVSTALSAFLVLSSLYIGIKSGSLSMFLLAGMWLLLGVYECARRSSDLLAGSAATMVTLVTALLSATTGSLVPLIFTFLSAGAAFVHIRDFVRGRTMGKSNA